MKRSLDPSCVLALDFNELTGSKAYDISGKSNHGTIYGAQRTRGPLGHALSFDGVDDYVAISKPDTTDEITVEECIYLIKSTQTQGSVAGYSGWDPTHTSYILWHDPDLSEFVEWRLQGIVSTSPRLSSNINILNRWAHVVATYSKSEGKLKLFVDGILSDQGDFSQNIAYPDIPWYIGKYLTYPFGGLIAFVRIYSRALSAQEIYEHYIYATEQLRQRVKPMFMRPGR